ncbi:pyridoxal phosphate-dependent aminotransferase [Haloglycomyces albus]|uniref:pyridoxal phosphate-dependent aminotransferase n=1 Tax=Haloglycomyces albus TaxID=526067 RepID=UPI00046D53CA|nr:pyridoxal phosphate-dependent aminotransferase [Haloglycomyces albus]
MTISATLAANETIAARRAAGRDVVPLAFGGANLPVHPALREAYASAASLADYGPVAGIKSAREALAGYFTRHDVPTDADQVLLGPGTKPLLFALLQALDGDVVVASPAWVSYAAQTAMVGSRPIRVPASAGEGGAPDPELLRPALFQAIKAGMRPRSIIVTLPDNPTGALPSETTMRGVCSVAEEFGLTIISDEIYRDLVFDQAAVPTPVQWAPDRTVVSTGLSKNFALGGWRLGGLRFSAGPTGERLMKRVRTAASEIWSTPPLPAQHAAALAWSDLPALRDRIDRSRHLHCTVASAVADIFRSYDLEVVKPRGAFYVWPDFEPWRAYLKTEHGISTSAELAEWLTEQWDVVTIPGSEFGDAPGSLTLRVAVPGLYGINDAQRTEVLEADDPLSVPWVSHALARLDTAVNGLVAADQLLTASR